MTLIPHIALPVAADSTGRLVVNDQDSPSDIHDCIELVLRTEKGTLDFDPDYGRPSLWAQLPEVAAALVTATIGQFEPRSDALIELDPDAYDDLVYGILVDTTGASS